MQNFYELLRLHQSASASMISDAFRSLDARAATEDDKRKLKEAFEVLSDSGRRADYDRMLDSKVAGEMARLKEKMAESPELLEQPKVSAAVAPDGEGRTYRDLLLPQVGKDIGINVEHPEKYTNARLRAVQRDYFSVDGSNGVVHIPYHQIMKILEIPTAGGYGSGVSFALSTRVVVEIFHLVIFKNKGGLMVGGMFSMDT